MVNLNLFPMWKDLFTNVDGNLSTKRVALFLVILLEAALSVFFAFFPVSIEYFWSVMGTFISTFISLLYSISRDNNKAYDRRRKTSSSQS